MEAIVTTARVTSSYQSTSTSTFAPPYSSRHQEEPQANNDQTAVCPICYDDFWEPSDCEEVNDRDHRPKKTSTTPRRDSKKQNNSHPREFDIECGSSSGGSSSSGSSSRSGSSRHDKVRDRLSKRVEKLQNTHLTYNRQQEQEQEHEQGQQLKQRVRVDGCGHDFCYECLLQHCKYAILRRDIPIPCPQVFSGEDRMIGFDIGTDNIANNNTNIISTSHCLSSELVQSLLFTTKTPEPSKIKCPTITTSSSTTAKTADSTITITGPKSANDKDASSWIVPPVVDNSNNYGYGDDEQADIECGLVKDAAEAVQLTNTFSTASFSCSSSSSSSSISSSDSLSISSLPEYWNKYLRHQRLKEDPTLLTCPQCEYLVPPPVKLFNETETKQHFATTKDRDNATELHRLDEDGRADATGYDAFEDLENSLASIKDSYQRQRSSSSMSSSRANRNNTLPYPQVSCPACHHNFCAIHGDIHAGETCEGFANSQRARDMEQSERTIRAISKACSHQCGAYIIRASGCDHVICTQCNQDMCYKCGTHVFLTGKVIRSCSNCKQGYVDHRYYGRYRLRILLILPIHLVFGALYMAVACAAAALTCGFGCCFACGTRGWCFESQVGETPATSTSAFRRSLKTLKPLRGLSMTTRIICLPFLELMNDCGCGVPVREDEKRRESEGG